MITRKLENGLTLQFDKANDRTIQHVIDYYKDCQFSIEWDCPFCCGDIDSLDYHTSGKMFEDSYRCEGDCECYITFISPKKYGEYHNTPISTMTVLIEFEWGDQPGIWNIEETQEELITLDYSDEPIKRDPAQLSLFDLLGNRRMNRVRRKNRSIVRRLSRTNQSHSKFDKRSVKAVRKLPRT